MIKAEYDFLDWISFPSSFKVVTDEERGGWTPSGKPVPTVTLRISPPTKVRAEVMVKTIGVRSPPPGAIGGARLHGQILDEAGNVLRTLSSTPIYGDTDWTRSIMPETSITEGAFLRIGLRWGGSIIPRKEAISKFDNLKIHMDDMLIYDNYFTALRPGKVIPVIWTPPERIIGAWQRFKTGEPMALFKPPRFLARI